MSSTDNATHTKTSSMDESTMAPKRLRECQQEHNQENINKTPRLSNYDSPHRIVQLIGKRFEKETENIKQMITESESRLLTVIDKSMSDFRKEMSKLTDRLINLTNRVEKMETVSNEIDLIKNDLDLMKDEIKNIKIQQLKHDNLQVACDLRINGVPSADGENLFQIFDKLCDTLNISTPTVKSIYRINNTRNNRNSTDTVILVNLKSPYDKNFILKNISLFRKSKKTNLQLKHVGIDSNNPFYVNENLTANNYKIFQNALKLKKQKHFDSVFTLRGLIYIRYSRMESPILIESIDQLNQLFRENPEQNCQQHY